MTEAVRTWDVVVVGAGAAGLTAGIRAGESGARTLVLDGASRVGAKLLVAGGGRCNVTHWRTTPADYQAGAGRNAVKQVLASFTADDTVAWMASLGVTLKREETGKLFPTTDKARTVLDALLRRLADVGATLQTNSRVTRVTPAGGRFVVDVGGQNVHTRSVVLATGGQSLPKTGSDGGGYAVAATFGHMVSRRDPALVSMVLREGWIHADLSGTSHPAQVTTWAGGKIVDRRVGSLLWTHFGVSGPVVMDASRFWLRAAADGLQPRWTLSLLPHSTFETVESAVLQVLASGRFPTLAGAAASATGLPEKLVRAAIRAAEVDPDTSSGEVRREDRRRAVHALTELELPVERDRGWNYAEVTAGGVPLTEVAWRTMQSRLVPGLHLAGEILDVDGRIGGFNFQWAWATGRLAGIGAASGGREEVGHLEASAADG